MASLYNLEIVTPDCKFFDGQTEMCIVRTTEGDVGILYDHEPLVAPVSIGKIRIRKDGEFVSAACAGGFLTVDEDRVVIVTDAAEWAEEIDIDRAKIHMNVLKNVLIVAMTRKLMWQEPTLRLQKQSTDFVLLDMIRTIKLSIKRGCCRMTF